MSTVRRLPPLALAVALAAGALLSFGPASSRADVKPRPRSRTYLDLQRELARGWNTWNTNSFLSHVLLPEGFAISMGLKPTWHGGKWLGEALRSNHRPEKVKLGLRSEDGRYTSLDLEYLDTRMTVESGTDGDDLLLLVEAKAPSRERLCHLVIDVGLLWSRPGSLARQGEGLVGALPGRTITVGTTAPLVKEAHAPVRTPYLAVALDGTIGIYTGRPRTVAEIRKVLDENRKAVEASAARWKDLSEPFAAMQTVLAWNAVYDAENDRVISPVSRTWNLNFAGFVLFDWDTYFAAAMYGLYDKRLAYANAVEITKSITPDGFIPNYANAYGGASFDRSQPPVGSRVVRELYKRYRDRWFLEEVYDELLTWNRWWPKARANGPYLSWGTNLIPRTDAERPQAIQFAKFESGLDNSPHFDGVPFKPGTATFELGDVGLTSLYVMDCDALAEIAAALGKTADARELRARADTYRKAVRTLWNEDKGIFLDKRTDTGQSSPRVSPTNFYPLLARAATPAQAERMMKAHYFNPAQFHGEFVMPSIARSDPAFKDNDYWRGRIWAPMNFLVYLGMRNYAVPAARKDLVERSRALLLKSWRQSGAVYENYNGTTGEGGDVRNADSFYHWGALLGFISFLERGDLPKPEAPLK
jgi:hypothetical protein